NGVEILWVWLKAQFSACVALPAGVYNGELGGFIIITECHGVHLPTAANGDGELLRQGVHHSHPYAVHAPWKAVVIVRKLAAGVQRGENHFNAWQAKLWV